MLSSLALTNVLACTTIAICLLAGWLRRRNPVSTLNIFLLLNICAYGIRPLLSASEGGYFHYHVSIEWSDYNLVLIEELIFVVSYLAAYLLATRNLAAPKASGKISISPKSVVVCWVIGTTALAIIHVLSHGAWLPGQRTETITSLVPFGKILFPLVVLPLSIMLPMAFSVALSKGLAVRVWMIAIAMIGLAEVAFVYQRGFLIYSLALILFAWGRVKGKLPVVPTVVTVCFAALLLFGMRPFVRSFSSLPEPEAPKEAKGLMGGLKDNMLFTATFDSPDVGVIVREFTKHSGFLWGKSFLYDVTRVLPPATRLDLQIETITDSVNIFYWGEVYKNSHIGLAISLTDILYCNFGYAGLLLAAIPGLMTAAMDRWMANVTELTPRTMTLAYAALFSNGFSSEPAGLVQWITAIVLIGWAIQRFCEPRPPKAPLRRRPVAVEDGWREEFLPITR